MTKSKRWRLNNPEKFRQSQRESANRNRRKYRYGLTEDQYRKMVQDSEGKCAICQREFDVPFIDHDHETKQVRELLCRFCNTGLGMFGDNQEMLLRAIEYLKKHSDTHVRPEKV